MNYIYYSLYLIYTKVLFVQKDYPPIINITGILALITTFLVITILNYAGICVYNWERTVYFLSYAVLSLMFYWIYYRYYLKVEKRLIEKIETKSKPIKVIIVASSIAFIAIVVFLWEKITC